MSRCLHSSQACQQRIEQGCACNRWRCDERRMAKLLRSSLFGGPFVLRTTFSQPVDRKNVEILNKGLSRTSRQFNQNSNTGEENIPRDPASLHEHHENEQNGKGEKESEREKKRKCAL